MSLIKCPECEKEISDKAKACPNCAYPIAEETEVKAPEAVIEKKENKAIKVPMTGFLIGIALPFISWPILVIPVVGWIAYAGILFMPVVLPFLIKQGHCPHCDKKNLFFTANKKCDGCKRPLEIRDEVVIDLS